MSITLRSVRPKFVMTNASFFPSGDQSRDDKVLLEMNKGSGFPPSAETM